MVKNECEYVVTFTDGYKYTALECNETDAVVAAEEAYPDVVVESVTIVEDIKLHNGYKEKTLPRADTR